MNGYSDETRFAIYSACPHLTAMQIGDVIRALESTAEQKALRMGAECYPIAVAERNHERARQERLLAILMGIFNLTSPPDTEANGKLYTFVPQDPAIWIEAWKEMSKRIREIPAAIDKERDA